MKLIDVLVEELPKRGGWPEGAKCITQDRDWKVEPASCHPSVAKCDGDGFWFLNSSRIGGFEVDALASDHTTAIITREQYEAALAAKNEGWIEWGGGECPVPCGTMVDVKHRCGDVSENQQAWPKFQRRESDVTVNQVSKAGYAFWRHDNLSTDIIAYRLHQPQQVAQTEAEQEAALNERIGQAPGLLWNGEGLPPVGCECEYRKHKKSEQSEWFHGVVKYASECTVVVQPVCYAGETVGHPANFEFRPILSEADRKRYDAVQALCDAGGGNGKVDENAGYGSCWFDVYDAIAAGKIPGVKLED